MTMEPVVVGIIGCGVISDAYLKGATRSALLKVKAVADLRHEMAVEKANMYGCEAVSIDNLLADPDIEIVLNLTIPAVHAKVDLDILAAGKHVYSEKPLAATFKEGAAVIETAKSLGFRIGCAPDTFFGASHQTARKLVDDGMIGSIVGGSVTIASRGMEHWHPDPRFFYQQGGGPHADVGPYYMTQLVNLLGPVKTVSATATRAFDHRTITSEKLSGTTFEVSVPTTINGSLLFASGANVALTMSWDVWASKRPKFEIYGTEGSLQNADPNHFGGVPEISIRGGEWEAVSISDFAFGAVNRTTIFGHEVADYRSIGLVDMAVALRTGRPHRASSEMAYHVLEIIEALEASSKTQGHVNLTSRCERPQPIANGTDERALL
jgi:predicted dehydrogenase